MKFTIEIDTSTATNEELSCLVALLNARSQQSTDADGEDAEGALLELSEYQINEAVKDMLDTAIAGGIGDTITVPPLYEATTKKHWADLHPTTRKAIGRRFRQVADADSGSKKDDAFGFGGGTWVEFKERNPQNMAIYVLSHAKSDGGYSGI